MSPIARSELWYRLMAALESIPAYRHAWIIKKWRFIVCLRERLYEGTYEHQKEGRSRMRNDLDYNMADKARELVKEGDKTISVNCMCCQGHSMPGREEGEPGYCPSCDGTTYIKDTAWKRWSWERKIDYWQARAMLAEMALEGKS